MSTAPVDPYAISMEELQNLAAGVPLPPPEQPRDEQGRFVAQEPPAEPAAEPATEPENEPEPEQFFAEREIDLEDGSGVQVFRGVGDTQEAAYEALADELAKAQTNATKKIRELAAKAAPPAEPEKPLISQEDAFLISQGDADAIQRAVDARFQKAEEARKKQEEAVRQRVERESQIADEFLAANPDYYVTPQNGRRLLRQLALDNLEPTLENLTRVYTDLKSDGLITAKPAEPAPAPRPRSSGLSTRSSVAPPPVKTGPTQADLAKMSLEQLRDLAGGYIYNR